MEVKKQNNEKEQGKIRKKIRILNDIFEGSALFGGIVGGFAAVALLMGGAAELTANLTMQATAQDVYQSSGYQIFAEEGLTQLDKKLAEGQISQDEYNEGVDALYSIPEVIRYAETATDEELLSFMDSYNESKELSKAVFTKGFPIFGSTSAVCLAGAAVAGKASKKARKEFEEAGGTFDVTQSFDK